MFQIRHGGVSYNLQRDLLNIFRVLARTACYRLAEASWHPVIREWAERSGLTEAELSDAAAALARFVNVTSASGAATIDDAWQMSGMDRLPKPALMALLFELGSGTVSAFFTLTRESQQPGYVHPEDPLVSALAEQAGHALNAPSARVRKKRVGEIRDNLLR